jgi:hypothetical protein
VVNGTVYLGGHYYDPDHAKYVPCYWVGATRFDLPVDDSRGEASGRVCAITVSGGIVYTAGDFAYSYPGGAKIQACYWAGQTRTDLPDEGILSSYAQAISVSDGKVYTGGYLSDQVIWTPCYWVDSTRMNIPVAGTRPRMITGICVTHGVVYTVGKIYGTANPPAGNGIICYWTDMERTELSGDGVHPLWASSIFVPE